jgi:hypothetical protein
MVVLVLFLLIAALLVGGYFLLRAFARVSQAMKELQEGLAELGEMGPRLQRLAGDVSQLADSIEERRHQ